MAHPWGWLVILPKAEGEGFGLATPPEAGLPPNPVRDQDLDIADPELPVAFPRKAEPVPKLVENCVCVHA